MASYKIQKSKFDRASNLLEQWSNNKDGQNTKLAEFHPLYDKEATTGCSKQYGNHSMGISMGTMSRYFEQRGAGKQREPTIVV